MTFLDTPQGAMKTVQITKKKARDEWEFIYLQPVKE